MDTSVRPVLVGRGLAFAEGVNFDRDGTLYCVDVAGGGIWRRRPGGALEEWVRTGGAPNGSRFGPGGDLFVADCGRRAILRLSPTTGQETIYADRYMGEPFRGPNDLCFGPDGTLYFTDPAGSSLTDRIGAVYAVAPDGAVALLAAGLAFPNGVAVTPDGTMLIVAETHTGRLRCYRLDAAPRYKERDTLVTLHPAAPPPHDAGPDGMAFGADGNLYVAHYGAGCVQVIAPDGAVVRGLSVGVPTPTNVAFWQDSLYVSEGMGGAIYRLDIKVGEQQPFMRPW